MGRGEWWGVVNFDLVVPTENGAVYPYFMCATDAASASTEVGMRVSVKTAHCLLGHWNKNSM